MKIPDAVKIYLNKYASTHWKLEWNRTGGIEIVIVIPAIAELENIPVLLKSLSENDKNLLSKTLILFVVNNLMSSSDEVKENNRKTIELLRCALNKNLSGQITERFSVSGLLFGLVDVSAEGNEFDEKTGGVGMARKAGMDLALTAFDYTIPKKKILISLDADCTVDNNYLSAISEAFNNFNLNATTIEFSHNIKPDSDQEAILCYEIFLRYYVAGLLYAKSPFAYHAIGSAFACDHEAYMKVGGMNKRKAAEDFYFLQKLAKLYPIVNITTTIVSPSARKSWRVPFGTGKSVTEFQTGVREFLLYDPCIFKILKEWLEAFQSDLSMNPDKLLIQVKKIHPELHNFLLIKKFPVRWEKILANSISEKQLAYQRKNWFDSFNTLKLVHHLRNTAYPMLEIKNAIKKMFKQLAPYNVIVDELNKKESLNHYLSAIKEIEKYFSDQVEY